MHILNQGLSERFLTLGPCSTTMSELKLGKYRHFKGELYEVIGVARHSETLEEFVVYRALYKSEKFGMNTLWIRSKAMFIENVNVDGKEVPRFRYIE